jgi:hypothetical protein
MFARLQRFFERMRGSSLLREDYTSDSRQSIENTDALSASGMRDVDPSGSLAGYSFPPKYVPPVDEGRARH